jgi:hypothetical protein
MTLSIHERVAKAESVATQFSRCSREQALTYACECVADEVLGARVMEAHELDDWLQSVCHREDIDVPTLQIAKARPRTLASTDIDSLSICLFGRNTTLSTLLHEVAHASVRLDGHGVLFRDELVRLTRAHLSVDYAALLHSLFVGLGLEAAPWGASAHRR